MRLLKALPLIIVSLVAASAVAERPYVPKRPIAFGEEWRWSELEALVPYTVRDVEEAPDGTLWFGVVGGIVEYDGYTATPYWFKDQGLDPGAVSDIKVSSNGSIYALAGGMVVQFKDKKWIPLLENVRTGINASRLGESADGSIWMALPGGLYRIRENEVSQIELEMPSFSGLLVDSQNHLWLLNARSGEALKYELDTETGLPTGNPFRVEWEPQGYPTFVTMTESQLGHFWLAANCSSGAFQKIDGENVEVIRAGWKNLVDTKVQSIIEQADGTVWLLAGEDLVKFRNGKWSKHDASHYTSDIPFLTQLSSGRLIMGGRNDSVHIVDLSDNHWTTLLDLNYQCQDVTGADWFISVDRRIVRHYSSSGSWVSYGEEDGLINLPNSIISSGDGTVWVSGSHNEDAAVAWLKDGEWDKDIHSSFSRMISHTAALVGKDGYVYFGNNMEAKDSAGRSAGLLRYKNLGDQVRYDYLTPPQVPQRITDIAQTPDGDLWFAGRTLSRFREDQPLEVVNTFDDEWPESLNVDSAGTLWAGNWRSGLYQKEGNKWIHMLDTKSKGKLGVVDLLSSSSFPGLWVVTVDGLNRFDGQAWSQNVLIPDLFIKRRGSRLIESPAGALWINLASRTWNYNLDPTLEDADTKFRTIRHRPDLNPPDTVLRPYDEEYPESGTAHFSWSGLDAWSLTGKEKLEYSYRLNDGEWSVFNHRTDTVVPSMAAGAYRLEVRSRDSDWNIDPTPAVAHFSVTPFLWKRPWFLTSMALTLIMIVSLIVMIVRMRIRHIVAMEEFKIDFFTRVSHELRTPLSVVIGPIQSLLKTALPTQKEPLEMAYRNARRMQGLVDTLLEFRKVELGKLAYEPVRANLSAYIRELVYSHAVLWEEKAQEFSLEVADMNGDHCFDPEMLQHIVSNILSNAVKYTPEKGMIRMYAEICVPENDDLPPVLSLKICDTGVGISTAQQEAIFDPFYRGGVKSGLKGTGIGLAYTKELISLWSGEISVVSPIELIPGRTCGSQFHIRLPLVEDESVPTVSLESLESLGEPLPSVEELDEAIKKSDRPSVLIVEDNTDVSAFLALELKKSFQIHVASNGKEGLKEATELMPDLVITDLMMPEMDGLELCAKLKSTTAISHIPVLMLTAKGSDEFRLKGIQEGADDYFIKPVNTDILKARIHGLLESRRRLKERFTREVLVKPQEGTVTSADEAFLQKAVSVMEDNMRGETFGVEEFAVKIGMGRTSLYRKMKAVTGLTPHEFIKSMRLKRAAQLLSTGNMNVSETYEEVGISTISYFSKIFREEYGCTPSEYRNRAKITPNSQNADHGR
jgi:signal transduction histidine kinase/DNA-binding response OmpR family regulator